MRARAFAFATAGLLVAVAGCSRSPTFTHEIAPVLHRRCAPCHHAGGAAPFALVTYADAAPRARQLERVTARGYMPPWKAVALATTPPVHYANERRLDAGERALLQRWATAGAPRGDGAEPPAPRFQDGWQLGAPDAVVKLPPYTLAADGPDVYRNFVVPSPLPGTRWVAAWEFRPDTRAIHHAILNLDATGWARKRDALDAAPGFDGMDPGDIQAPDGFYLVWTPGQAPTPPDPHASWPLDARTDLVLQLHLRPTGKPETIAPTLALYLAPAPPTQARVTLRIGDVPIDLAPGARNYQIHDQWTLPVAVELVSLFPHAHYLAQKMRVWARLPDGHEQPLLAIDDWDPAWQDEYVLAEPLALPRGSSIAMEFTYDNSADNPRNPNRPPARVVTGERTVDEMGNVTLVARVASPADKLLLREAKFRRQLAAGAGARAHYNLGNTLMAEGRAREAVEEFRRALTLDGELMAAQVNLGAALLAIGDVEGARAQLDAATRRWPDSATAHANFGRALLAAGRQNEAAAELERTLVLDPTFAPARSALEALHRQR